MPAYLEHEKLVRPRERVYALAAVALIQAALAFALLTGLHVDVTHPGDVVQHLIDITLPKPSLPPPPPRKPKPSQTPAPKAAPAKLGGSPGPKPAHAPPSVTPIVAVKPTAAASAGGSGSGPALGAGAGGGAGGNGYGYGDDEGGSDLEQIAGEITQNDYPRHLRDAGVGGHVAFVFSVEPNGRVGRCTVTHSSGVPELDSLTCRLIQQRFVYHPSTDRYGRPIADEVEGDHDWIATRR